MDVIFDRINELSSFMQSLLASAVFALLLYLTQKIIAKSKESGSRLLRKYLKDEYIKHLIHKELLNSNDSARVARGYFIITMQAFRWFTRGVLVLVFFLAVNSITTKNWLMLACYWVMFNCFIEAYMWFKDRSRDVDVAHISQEIKDEVISELKRISEQRDEKQLPNKSQERTE